MKVPFATFVPMHNEIRKDLDAAYNQVLDRSYFIQGEECTKFEEEFATYCGAKYCIGVATGLLPNTGVTLPFVSYGLTSLWSLYIGIGLVLNVGLQPKKY